MDDMIAQIKDRVRIEDLVERAGLTVVGHGRRRRAAAQLAQLRGGEREGAKTTKGAKGGRR